MRLPFRHPGAGGYVSDPASAVSTLRRFFMPSLSPAMFNVASIFSAFAIVPLMPYVGLPDIYGIAIGTLLGGLGQIRVEHGPASHAYFNRVMLEDGGPFAFYAEGMLAGGTRAVLGAASRMLGLQGTGDTLRNSQFTEQSLQSMLDRMGVNVRDINLRTRNVAAVIITADLPPDTYVGPSGFRGLRGAPCGLGRGLRPATGAACGRLGPTAGRACRGLRPARGRAGGLERAGA